ncbi:RTA1-domain-containing protein [Hysterangium stoloniferum]|nr:RTA1-domain-containing protein [Hysterangium stoloniferum]
MVALLTRVLLTLLPAVLRVAANTELPHPVNPFVSPSTDPYNPLRYTPNNALTAVAVALYLLTAVVMTYFMYRRGARFMAAMVIGAYTMSLGLSMRFGLHSQPESKGIYILEYLLVVLSPCAFIASDYVLLGRLSQSLGMGEHLLISPNRITRVFIASDVATFLIQAAGASISISGSTSGDLKRLQAGSHIFLAGLALQAASFIVFMAIFLLFLYRVRKCAPQVWNPSPSPPWWKHWRMLSVALGISCVGILIRSAYRTIELSEGFEGRLGTSEGFFYGLDTLPLFLAIVVYVPFWPSGYIKSNAVLEKQHDLESSTTKPPNSPQTMTLFEEEREK